MRVRQTSLRWDSAVVPELEAMHSVLRTAHTASEVMSER